MRTRLSLALATAALAAAPAVATAADATFHTDPASFESAVSARGLQVDLAEDFEDAKPANGLLGTPLLATPTGTIDDPLDTRGGGRFFAPGQIPAHLRIQSNRAVPGVSGPAPIGRGGLAISRPSSTGTRTGATAISSPFQQSGPASTDVIAVDAAHEAYALDLGLVRFSFVEDGASDVGGPLEVRVFDRAGAPMGTKTIGAAELGSFTGVVAPAGRPIGRINVFEPGGSELIHSVVAYDADGGGDTGTSAPASNPLADILVELGL